MRFFDSLTHATEDGIWLGGTRYDASLERLLKEMELGADRACLVNIAEYHDNQTLLSFAKAYPNLFVPIAGYNPSAVRQAADVPEQIAQLASEGFAGIKLHPRLNNYDPLDARCLSAIKAAGQHGLVVFLDTLFRQRNIATRHPADVIDVIATQCKQTRILLLHGGGSHLLDMFEMVRMHAHLILDISFTMMRYAGSSIDQDIRFLCQGLDQRLTVGSDFPEYTPLEARQHLSKLTEGLNPQKLENICSGNLDRLFSSWPGVQLDNNRVLVNSGGLEVLT